MEQEIKNAKRDIDKFAEELQELITDMKYFKENTIVDNL